MNHLTSLDNSDIERIVRTVVDRLLNAGKDQSSSSAPAASAGETSPPYETSVDDRVITLATLETCLTESTAVLCVPTGAVVTPAVKDELRKRKIDLRRGSLESCHQASVGPTVVVAMPGADSQAWRNLTNVREVIGRQNWIAEVVARSRTSEMTLLLTDQPEAASCAVNRHTGVRCLALRDGEDWRSDRFRAVVQQLGANVISVDPRHINPVDRNALLKQIWELRGLPAPGWLS